MLALALERLSFDPKICYGNAFTSGWVRCRMLALERLSFDPNVCYGNAFTSEWVRGRMLAMEGGHFALVKSFINIVRRNGAQPIDARSPMLVR